MANNYLTYPFHTMRITQSYNGTTSHKPHNTGSPKDYPIDEGGKDGGKDPVYAPCDMVVKRIYGVGNSGVNTIWLESTKPVKLANGKTDYITLMLTHSDDSDLRRRKVGEIIKKGSIICYEGTDGASGNHIHLSAGLGKMVGNGWTKNSKGKYVLTTTGGALKPEDAFFIDLDFTVIRDSKGLKFKTLPMDEPKPGTYIVTADVLNVRTGTTKDARIADVLLKGAKVEIDHVKRGEDGDWWGKILGMGWISMRYAKKVKG